MAVVRSSVKIAGMVNAVFKAMTLMCEIGVNGFSQFVKTLVALSCCVAVWVLNACASLEHGLK